jgi:hypothetical protein
MGRKFRQSQVGRPRVGASVAAKKDTQAIGGN